MEKLKMQLFGGFRLIGENAEINEAKYRSGTLICLLTYILVNRGHVLSKQKLTGTFLENGSKNPETALKVLMHRLRNELKVLGDEDFILTSPEGYSWNSGIEVEADYEKLENMVSRLRKTDDPEEQEELYLGIISCYGGNVSTKIANEPWILPRVAWWQSVYLGAVKSLCAMLEAGGKWEEESLICSQALGVNPMDEELYCFLIRSFYKQEKYDFAMAQYEKAKGLLYKQMGIKRSEKLQSVFQEMMTGSNDIAADIGKLIGEVKESDAPESVFFCDFQIFRQIYRMEMRRIDRLGIAEYIVLFTIRRCGSLYGRINADRGMNEGMEILERSIGQSLRSGDVAAKYSPTQIAVLLPTCTCENGVKAAERVRKDFVKHIGARKLELTYEMAELSPPRGQEAREAGCPPGDF